MLCVYFSSKRFFKWCTPILDKVILSFPKLSFYELDCFDIGSACQNNFWFDGKPQKFVLFSLSIRLSKVTKINMVSSICTYMCAFICIRVIPFIESVRIQRTLLIAYLETNSQSSDATLVQWTKIRLVENRLLCVYISPADITLHYLIIILN